MTTVTLTDRRIDRQHSRAGQDGCHTAETLKGWGIAGGWVNLKSVGRWNAWMWQGCASSFSFGRVFCCDKKSARCEELPGRRAAVFTWREWFVIETFVCSLGVWPFSTSVTYMCMYIYICIYIYVYIFICSMLYTSVLNASGYMRICFVFLLAGTNRYFGCRACMQTCIMCAGG